MRNKLILLAVLAIGGGLFSPSSLAATSDQVLLRSSTVVEDRIIRLSDLFTSAGDHADTVVAYAPAPGRRAVFDSRWLYRVARAYGLDWRPLTRNDQAVVERASTVISREEIESYIVSALADQTSSSDIKVELSNPRFEIHLPGGASPDIAIEDVVYNQRSQHFSATVVAAAADPNGQRYRVTGRVHRIREIPVLTRTVPSDEVIRESDLEWISVRADHLRRDTVHYSDELVGKSPKHSLRPGRPIRSRDVQDPILVPKRTLVTIYFQRPQMTLTAKGRAMEDGSNGDVIRIANIQSNTVIEAVVVGTGAVSVATPNHVLTN